MGVKFWKALVDFRCHVRRSRLGPTYPNDNVVIVLVQSQKLISHVDITYQLSQLRGGRFEKEAKISMSLWVWFWNVRYRQKCHIYGKVTCWKFSQRFSPIRNHKWWGTNTLKQRTWRNKTKNLHTQCLFSSNRIRLQFLKTQHLLRIDEHESKKGQLTA